MKTQKRIYGIFVFSRWATNVALGMKADLCLISWRNKIIWQLLSIHDIHNIKDHVWHKDFISSAVSLYPKLIIRVIFLNIKKAKKRLMKFVLVFSIHVSYQQSWQHSVGVLMTEFATVQS